MNAAAISRLNPPELRSSFYPAYSARDLLNAIFYHRRAMLIAFLIPCLLGLAAALLSRTSYVAQARLLVLYGSDYVFHPGNGSIGNDITLDRNQIMQGEQQILTSTTLATETLKAVGLSRVYPDVDITRPTALGMAAARFATDLTVNSIAMSNVIELSFRNLNAQVSADVLNELIAQYLQRRNTVFDKGVQAGGAQGGTPNDERAQFADRLHRAEAALSQFGAEHGISNLDEQISLLLRQKADNITEQNQTDQAVRETAARLDSLRKQLQGMPQSVQIYAESTRSQQTQGLTDNLLRLEATRRDLRSRYQDDFPLVRDVDAQIAAVQAQIDGTGSRESAIARQGRNTVYDELHGQQISLEAQLQGLRAKRVELAATADNLQQRLDTLNGFGRVYRDLQRTRDVLDESYRTIARTSEETQLSGAVERARGANVRVVQPPETPLVGSNPRKILLAVGILLGLMAAAAALAVSNALRQVFISVHDLERALGLPVLAAVPIGGAAAGSARRSLAAPAGRRPAAPALTGQASYGP